MNAAAAKLERLRIFENYKYQEITVTLFTEFVNANKGREGR